MKRLILITAMLVFVVGCASYYQQNFLFQQYFMGGDLKQAASFLDTHKPKNNDKSRLLYLLQQGVVQQMLGNYDVSNENFENAYLYTQDVKKSFSDQALGLLTNPMTMPYLGEDFEVVLIHYYKALNYLMLRNYDNALVECRRLNIELNELNDKYQFRKNRYRRDAFALNLMGIIFEATGNTNDAFISYRNAYEAYDEDYRKYFAVQPPEQLKADLLRTAYKMGFTDEARRYEELFGMKYKPEAHDAELVFFWMNGLGPVKDEWSINFVIVKGDGGLVTFVNDETGMSFPFNLGREGEKTAMKLGDLKAIRIAFPKYLARKPIYTDAELIAGDNAPVRLEQAENVNDIAFSTLEDRMVREFATSLLRFALKQTAEETVRNKNEGLGAVLSLVNAATEKADTRNWQTLPYSISYVRVPIPTGETRLKLNCSAPGKDAQTPLTFTVTAKKGEVLFDMFHTIESQPPAYAGMRN